MGEDLTGGLRERVAIETWIDARDDAGATAGFWQPQARVYAAIVPDIGTARNIEGEARRSTRRWRVTLRRPLDAGLTSRLIWGSQILSVLAVEDDPRQPDRLVLRCEGRPA